MKPYLFLYNIFSALGWAYVLFLSVSGGKTPAETWDIVEFPLKVVQTAAFLEILHSLFRLVRSPIGPSILQVGSRLFLCWVITDASKAAQSHWSLFFMVVSWSLVEVPRYTFYALNLYISQVPYPIFYLRYSLFFILYPTGITGELGQMIQYMPELKAAGNLYLWYLIFITLCLYVPGSPFMYMHMVAQRASAFGGRRPPMKPNGVEFPVTDRVTGERGTTETNKKIFAASIKGFMPEEEKRILKEKNWRFRYNKYVLNHAIIMASAKPEMVVRMAKQGLFYIHNSFDFVRDGKTMKVAEAMKNITTSFHTGIIKGTKPKPSEIKYAVNYKGVDLYGKSVEQQLDAWVKYGVIEQDTGDAIRRVCNTKEYLDLTGHYFVLLGATSAMGPLKCLLALGANIIAVDIDRPNVWKKLIEEEVKPSFGSIIFPMKKEQSCDKLDDEFYANCGCNLITQPPEICNWLKTVAPGKPLTVGGYAYLDGLLHVKLAIAMDAIMEGLCEARGKDVSLAFLCTPTDVHMIPKEAHEAAKANLRNAPWWQKMLQYVGSNSLKSNVVKPILNKSDNQEYYLVDGITVAQGPNYALAKRMQHWRCIVARANGHLVSTNIAPSTKTTSVISNSSFKAAYEGMPSFRPMEIMYQETSNAVMGALLLNDLFYPQSAANPNTKLSHPLMLFAATGFSGGLWRCAFTITSVGLWAALIFYLREFKFRIIIGLTAITSGLWYVATHLGAPHKWF